MDRPSNLPEYRIPPLNEVVLGVQFAPLQGYSTVCASQVRDLFKDEYPKIQEHPFLSPRFETFGGRSQPGINLEFGSALLRNRLWFVADDGTHLLQFQDDRLLLNWRRVDGSEPYPRFDSIAPRFNSYLSKLNQYAEKAHGKALEFSQVEATYINIIPVSSYRDGGEWLDVLGSVDIDVESLNLNFEEVVNNESGQPVARVFYEIQSVASGQQNEKSVRFAMTYRGMPAGSGIEGCMEFLNQARIFIVNKFSQMTTKSAHDKWERINND